MSDAPKRIAITGVAGFIGSNLANRLLSLGYAVVGIDNLAYGVREQIPDGVEFILADIRDVDFSRHLAGVDVLFHLAAKNCIADCQVDPVETADINVRGTANVFSAAVRAKVEKVVYAESSAVYEGSAVFPTPETQVAAQSFYAVSKLAGMEFAEAYRRYHGLRTTALRYFGVYGPRQDYRRTIPPLMSAFIIKLLRYEQPVVYGSGEKKRDFIYVDDVNNFHVQCINDRRTDANVYNLGSGKPYSVNEVYALIAELLGSRTKPQYLPDLEGEAQVTHADITKARSVGWEPKVSLDEGLRRSLEYIRGNIDFTATV